MSSSAEFVASLVTDSAFPPLADELRLFGQFEGAWDLEWRGKGANGELATAPGELTFGWVLGGRAVQDVWRMPLDPSAVPGIQGFHGTTIRFYDPQISAWRSTWLEPFRGRVRRFIGKPTEDGCIVLVSVDDDPMERWSFNNIHPNEFLWRGEVWDATKGEWILEDEMQARRRSPR